MNENVRELLEEVLAVVASLDGEDEIKEVLFRGYYRVLREINTIKENTNTLEGIERHLQKLEGDMNEIKDKVMKDNTVKYEKEVISNEIDKELGIDKVRENLLKTKLGQFKPALKINPETVRDLYLAGVKPPTIAKQLGIATSVVYYHLKKFGLK